MNRPLNRLITGALGRSGTRESSDRWRFSEVSRLPLLLFALAVFSSISSTASAETPRERVARTVAGLHRWLETSPHGERWKGFLLSNELEGQLAASAPDQDAVATILARYAGAKLGLDKPKFVAVRRALEEWQAEIAAPQPASLADAARAAVNSFAPPSEQELHRRKQQLTTAAQTLDRFLAGGGTEKEQGWKRYLLWSETQQQLRAETADARVLRAAEFKYFGLHRGLELSVFDAVRQRLRSYTNGLIVADPRARDFFDKQVNQLIALLDAMQLDALGSVHAGEQSLAVARILGWLEMAGQAELLVREARRYFARPNLHVQVSEKLLAATVNDEVRTRQRIRESILGTDIHGYPDTRARISIDFVPNESRAAFDFRVDGVARSENVGYNGPVTIYSSSSTTIKGSKRVYLDGDGFHPQPAQARCETVGVINGIAARLAIVENIAWRKAGQQKAQAEQIGNQRSEARVRRQVDEQADGIVAKMNSAFLDRFRLPLLRKDHFPRLMRFATSDDALLVTMLQSGAFQAGAIGQPPELEAGLDLSVRVHESLAGNFSEGLLGGETLSDVRLAHLLQEMTGEVPAELQPGPEKDPWSIKFAGSQPVSVRFDDQQIRIAVRGSEFTRGPQTIDEPIEIAATYLIEKTPRGAQLTRQGEVEVEFLARRSLSVTQVAFKTFMQTKFNAVFKPEIVGKGMELKGRSQQVTLLQLRQLGCDDGWAVFGWDASPAPLTAKRPVAGKR